MRYDHVAWCEDCRRETPRRRRGDCTVCQGRVRRATRRAKAMTAGAPLVRYGELQRFADELRSVWIRAAHEACEMCGTPEPPERLQWAHHWTRQDRAIRYHDDNSSALCSACHRRHTPARVAWWDWLRETRLGAERYARLEYLARAGGKLRQSDLTLIVLETQQRIEALAEGPRKEWARERAAKINERMVRATRCA